MANTVHDEVQKQTKQAQDNAHLQMMTLAKEMHTKLATFPLHIHTNAIDLLNVMCRNRQQSMQMEAMEQQAKAQAAQAAFEEERRKDHEARFKKHGEPEAVPQLVT